MPIFSHYLRKDKYQDDDSCNSINKKEIVNNIKEA